MQSERQPCASPSPHLQRLLLFITGCNRGSRPADVSITEPAYDGANVQFGDVFLGLKPLTMPTTAGCGASSCAVDGITPKQAGLWAGASTGSLIVAFALDETLAHGTATLAVVADDAAGNRAAAFDLNYTATADLPEVIVALTANRTAPAPWSARMLPAAIRGLDGIARQHQAHLFRRVIVGR